MGMDDMPLIEAEKQPSSILVVDDVLKNIQLMLTILSDEGYDIHFATNGANALQSLKDKHIDLILLDVMMPEMDGYEVCRRIKNDPATAEIPVIFLTAKDAVEDKVRGFELGAVDYVSKPFQAREILARIQTHLELRNARDTIRDYNQQLEQLLQKRTRELLMSERQAVFGQLVQGIVHNLKNPLAASMMSGQMITMAVDKFEKSISDEDRCEASEELLKRITKALGMIESSNNNLNDMISSLLAKSRQDKGEQKRDIDLNKLIYGEIDFLKADMVFKNKVNKEIVLHDEPVMVHVVPGEISQVFHNLVRNALDAMHGQKKQAMTIRTAIENDSAVLLVEDNGPGIPQDIVDRIFDPFFSTKPTQQDQDADPSQPVGTGLGLWMCQETITNTGGQIQVKSFPGEGTAFTVTLPLAQK